jgi:GntR family transcriptional regulator, transcriptional repressor for pyruvate dehydrogenase complex
MASAWCWAGLDLRQRLRHHRSDEHSHQLSYNSILDRTTGTVKPAETGFTLMAARQAPTTSRAPRRTRNLADDLVESLGDRIRDGRLPPGEKLPTEAEIMAGFGISRTVVREALSKLQAGGQVRTRHGIGTFVVGPGGAAPFRIAPEQLATLHDVIAMLELRIGVETEAASLAAQRRSEANLREMRAALDDFTAAVRAGRDAVAADFRFHLEVARATQNPHYAELLAALGASMIPRARLDAPVALTDERREYLHRVHGEHESVFDAISAQDSEAARAAMRTHLANSKARRTRAQVHAVGRVATVRSGVLTRRKQVVR